MNQFEPVKNSIMWSKPLKKSQGIDKTPEVDSDSLKNSTLQWRHTYMYMSFRALDRRGTAIKIWNSSCYFPVQHWVYYYTIILCYFSSSTLTWYKYCKFGNQFPRLILWFTYHLTFLVWTLLHRCKLDMCQLAISDYNFTLN